MTQTSPFPAPIPRGFYLRDTSTVARELLGKRIVRKTAGRRRMSGIITETEAYGHADDPASHAFNGATKRNRVMFGKVGIAYIYFTYGMHYCFNVVAKHPETQAGAVLIRGIEPEYGIEIMQKNRASVRANDLTNGPAKLAQAMQITKEQYGVDLTLKGSEIFITEGSGGSNKEITTSARVGIRKAIEKPWNFKME